MVYLNRRRLDTENIVIFFFIAFRIHSTGRNGNLEVAAGFADDHVRAELKLGLNARVDNWLYAKDLDLGGIRHVEDGRAGRCGTASWGWRVVRVLLGRIGVLQKVGVEVSRSTWDVGFKPVERRDRDGGRGRGLIVELDE